MGDTDAVKATALGLKNIKRNDAVPDARDGEADSRTTTISAALYGRVIGQWRTELGHVANIVGGADSQEKYGSQQGVRFDPIAASGRRRRCSS